MIEVEMGEDDIGDVGRRHAVRAERRRDILTARVDRVDVAQLLAVLRAVPRIHEDRPAPAADQQRPRRHGDPVSLIGGIRLPPEGPRDHAEHRAAVQREAPGLDRVQPVLTDDHATSRKQKVGFPWRETDLSDIARTLCAISPS